MDELINTVVAKTGLPADRARSAVEAVLGFIKEKLPAPIAGQVEQALAGGGGGGVVDDLKKGLGGLLGK